MIIVGRGTPGIEDSVVIASLRGIGRCLQRVASGRAGYVPLFFLASESPESFFTGKTLGAILASVAFLVLIFVLMRRTAARSTSIEHRSHGGPAGRQPRAPVEPLRGEAERLLVELEDFGREIEGRLETRLRHLTRLIAEADKAIERLNAAVAASGEKTGQAMPEGESPPVRARIVALSEAGKQPADIAQALGLPKGEVELVLGLELKNRPDRP